MHLKAGLQEGLEHEQSALVEIAMKMTYALLRVNVCIKSYSVTFVLLFLHVCKMHNLENKCINPDGFLISHMSHI